VIQAPAVEAAYTLHFLSDGLTEEQFDAWTEAIIASFVYHTPLRDCPEKLRVHRDFQFCCEGSSCRPAPEGEFEDAIIYLVNSSDKQPGCKPVSAVSMSTIPIDNPDTYLSTPLHELGHALGLWDQYCYWPVENNPNPVNLSEAGCTPLEEGDSYYEYCSNQDRLPEGTQPQACFGNINHLGGLTVMGRLGDPSRNHVSHPRFGFTEEEYRKIAERIKCG
jgi:hypothetical protein